VKLSNSIPETKDVQSLLGIISAGDVYVREFETRLEEYQKRFLEFEDRFPMQVEINSRQAELIFNLEHRVGLNSSKPPSSDGLQKPPAPKRANVKERKPVWQKGCKGKTLFRFKRVDHVERHFPHGCTHCGHALD